MLALLASAAASNCASDAPGSYGDALAGAGGFAELVGIACSGECYKAASAWSAVARLHGNADVSDVAACRTLCASNKGCEVFTFDNGECRLMRQLSDVPSPSLVAAEGNTSGLTTTCVVDSTSLGVRDFGSTTIGCCAALTNATAAIAAGGAAKDFIDSRLCQEAGCAAALRSSR